MDEGTRAQLALIREITTVLARDALRAWLFGGWGLDARIGHVTRDHGDVEFWVDRGDADSVRDLLVGAGAVVMDTQPPEESTEYTHGEVWFSTAYFETRPGGGFFQPRGRFDDWVFPAGSFPDAPVELAGSPVLAMSVAGMLAMKEQYPRLRNGRPWREKDVADIRLLRSMLAQR